MPSNIYTTSNDDLDDVFEPRGSSSPHANVNIKAGSQDLADRYYASGGTSVDQITTDTGIRDGSTDLRYIFRGLGLGGSGPTITDQPDAITRVVPASASFTVAATPFSGSLTYQWERDTGGGYGNISGATSATYTISTTVAGDQGNYRCKVTDSAGTVTSAAAYLTVNYVPVFTTNPSGATLNDGDAASFTIAITEGRPSPATYQWQKNGSNVSNGAKYAGATSTNLTFLCDYTDDGANYRCVATNSAGSVNSSNATLVVNFAPVLTTDTTASPSISPDTDDTLTLSVVAIGRPTSLTYQWYKNTISLGSAHGAQTATFSIAAPGLTVGDSGNYHCDVTNSMGTSTSSDLTITVTLAMHPPSFDTQPSSQSVRGGTTATFTVAVSGVPTPTLQWQKNGSNISGQTSTSLSLTSTTNGDEGTYRCVATNSSATVNSNNATLDVVIDPSITSNPTGGTLNIGDVANFVVSATGDTLSYQWKKNGSNVGTNSTSYSFTVSSSGDAATYTCVVSNPYTSVTSSGAVLSVNITNPTITVSPTGFTANDGDGPYALFCEANVRSEESPVYFTWKRDGTTIVSAHTGNISSTVDQHVMNPVDYADDGVWTCVVTTSYGGSSTSSGATVTII